MLRNNFAMFCLFLTLALSTSSSAPSAEATTHHYLKYYEIRYGPNGLPMPVVNGQPLVELTIDGRYGSLPSYKYVGYTYTHHHVPVGPSVAAHHAAVLTQAEINALFGGQSTIRLSKLQEAELLKIHREIRPNDPPLRYGAARDANGNARYDAEGWVIPDRPTADYRTGKTMVWPADYVTGESRLYWNLTTPAVFEYLVRYTLKLQSHNAHARIFIDESGTYGEDLFARNHVAAGGPDDQVNHVISRLNDLNRAIRSRPDPAGRLNQGLIPNSGWRRPGHFFGQFWNRWYETLLNNPDTFDGLMVENVWLEDGWATDVGYYRDKIVALNNLGKKVLFAATNYPFLESESDPHMEKLWLWLHLVAQAPGTYVYLNPNSETTMLNYDVYAKTLGTPLEDPYLAGNTWRRRYQGGEIVFDITSGSIDAIQLSAPTATAPTATASFLGVDTTTQGNWRGVYGRDGYVVVADASALPSYATVLPMNHRVWTWDAAPTSTRALQRAGGAGRIAATWYSRQGFAVEVNLSDGQPHQVALYAVDWDSGGRAERIDVVDVATGTVLDSQLGSVLAGGQYEVWRVRGRVRFDVVRLAGSNAVVGAVFLDP